MIQTGQDLLRVASYAGAVRRQQVAARQRGRAVVAESSGVLVPYVNWGRWVADCVCGSGVACDPAWPLGLCLECGSRYEIDWPSSRRAIEQALVPRHVRNRHWVPGETVADLRAENKAHDVKGGG